MKITQSTLLVSLFTLLAPLSSMRAAVIYQDNFTGSSITDLGAPWVPLGPQFIKADGSIDTNNNFAHYITSASMNITGGTMGAGGSWRISSNQSKTSATNWFGLALDTGSAPTGVYDFDGAYVLNSSNIYVNGFTTVSGGLAQGVGTTVTYSILVDNTGTDTVLSFSRDSTLMNTWTNTGNGIITYTSAGLVGIGTSVGSFNSFTVDEIVAVPEPSTYGLLLGLGAIPLILRRRRR